MGTKQNEFELQLHPLNENSQYIGRIWMEPNLEIFVPSVVILDASGSMSDATTLFVKDIIPMVMSELCYTESQTIDLITFGKSTEYHPNVTASSMQSLPIIADGTSYMAPAIRVLRETLERFKANHPSNPYRVLTISGGAINDIDDTEKETKSLIEFLDKSNFTINSQAVRLLTSESEPDTKALCGLLQINNTTTSKPADINASESKETIAKTIADLFRSDDFGKCKVLRLEEQIILKFPWNIPSLEIVLEPGWNVFWLTQIPTGVPTLSAGSESWPMEVIHHNQLALADFQTIMDTKLDYFADRMKILKVVGTTEANQTVRRIFEYFQTIENKLAPVGSTSTDRKISNRLAGIANTTVTFNNSKEMAEFLCKNESQRLEQNEEAEERCKTDEKENKFKLQKVQEEIERLKREQTKLQLEKKKLEEAELLKREEEERFLLRKKLDECRKLEEGTRKNSNSLTTSAANKVKKFMGAIGGVRVNQGNDSNSIQTVIIFDESASVAKGTQRFTEKIIPLALSKLSHKKSQLVHSLTFGSDKTSVIEKLQSLVQTLDANKEIRILFLTNAEVQEVETFAETIMKFLSRTHSSADLHVVRLASECEQSWLRISNTTTKYNLFDVDANESNEFIAIQIEELLGSGSFPMHKPLRRVKNSSKTQGQSKDVGDKQSGYARSLDYVEKAQFSPENRKIKTKRRHRRSGRTCGIFSSILTGMFSIYSRCYCYLICFIIIAIVVALFYFGIIKIEFHLF